MSYFGTVRKLPATQRTANPEGVEALDCAARLKRVLAILLGGSNTKCRNQEPVRIIAILIGVIVALGAAFLTWKDGKSPYKAAISGAAAFAATVLLAIAVEQALGLLK